METLQIQLTNQKAMKLLMDMEELNLIKVLKNKPSLKDLRHEIKTKMTNEEVNHQLTEIRNEWLRNI